MQLSQVEPAVKAPVGALRREEAARYLGIGTTKLWMLVQLGKIRQTSYGTYPIAELDRHLAEEVEQAEQGA